MIRATTTPSGAATFVSSVGGIAIYLDNWAIKILAKSKPELGDRFVAAVHRGADVLFSVNHAFEAVGPQGKSSDAFRAFLNRLGGHWWPIRANIFAVLDYERKGMSGSQCCHDEELLKAYFRTNTSKNFRGSGTLIDLSSDYFFRLGNFIDWLAPQRSDSVARSAEFDRTIQEYMGKLRAKFRKDPAWLDAALPAIPFSASHAATFAWNHLLRALITDFGYQIRPGDAVDLMHAVMASAFSNFAALDKQWKRRVEGFPKPNRNPRVYYEPELEAMLSDIEAALTQLGLS